MKKTFLFLVIIFLVIAAFVLFTNKDNQKNDANEKEEVVENKENGDAVEDNNNLNDTKKSAETVTVTYTSSGYSPSSVTISDGDTINFINNSSGAMWTASAIHPTHAVYPSSGIAKCSTAEEEEIFDSCAGVTAGGNWSFTFNEKGTWGYHNHLRTNHTGTIIVE